MEEGLLYSGSSRWLRWSLAIVGLLALIIVPFALFGDRVETAILSSMGVLRSHPLLAGAVIFGLLLGDVVLPVPSSVVSALAGAALGFWGGVVVIWLGMSGGCLFGYWLGASAGRFAMRRIVGEAELTKARVRLIGAGAVALVLTRGVPVLAESMVLGAGAARMRLTPFCLLTFTANLAVALGYAAVGALALSEGSFFVFFFGLCALPAVGWLLWTRFGPDLA